MGAWCTHVICYGFHCIPRSEGRDDVFQRWSQDGPRPQNMSFMISHVLWVHTACFTSQNSLLIQSFSLIISTPQITQCDCAWFLSSYSALNPCLAKVNSSAAECGNSGLDQIWKSISYMSQNRAILYIKIFISVWNQRKLRKQLSLTNNKGTSLRFASHMNGSSSIQ